jgi:hypothetical protein
MVAYVRVLPQLDPGRCIIDGIIVALVPSVTKGVIVPT